MLSSATIWQQFFSSFNGPADNAPNNLLSVHLYTNNTNLKQI